MTTHNQQNQPTGAEIALRKADEKIERDDAASKATSNIQEAMLNGDLLRMIKVRGENKSKCYMTLRKWGENQWVSHYYNADLDSFEFGRYYTNLGAGIVDFDNRVMEYNRIDERSLFNF